MNILSVRRTFLYDIVFIAISSIFFLWLILSVYDSFFWAPDEGAYAYVADMINAGAILHKDIKDIHTGYINFTNAWVLRNFGDDLRSLRFPIVAMTISQAILLGSLFVRKSWLMAFSAMAILSTMSFVQFINPTAHWYALFIICLIIFALHTLTPEHKLRLLVVGLLLGMLFGFRQLSGAIGLIGVVAYLLYEENERAELRPINTFLAKVIYAFFLLILIYYFVEKSDRIGFLLFGIAPIGLLVKLMLSSNISNLRTLTISSNLAAGFLVALMPLLIYHLVNHSVGFWIDDVVVSAFGLTELGFMKHGWYETMLFSSLANSFSGTPSMILNGLFWVAVLVVPNVLGLSLIWGIKNERKLPAFAVIPVFYAVVSAHYQIPIYLFYSSALTIVAVSYLYSNRVIISSCISLGMLVMSGVAFIYHAAQPVSRGINGIVEGRRIEQIADCGVPHCSLKVEESAATRYQKIITIVEKHSRLIDSILTIPSNPEINYFSKRRSPLSHFNIGVSLATPKDVIQAISILQKTQPKLIFHDEHDKYNTPVTNTLMLYVENNYKYLETVDGLKVYIYE